MFKKFVFELIHLNVHTNACMCAESGDGRRRENVIGDMYKTDMTNVDLDAQVCNCLFAILSRQKFRIANCENVERKETETRYVRLRKWH